MNNSLLALEQRTQHDWQLRVEFLDSKSPNLSQVLKIAEESQKIDKIDNVYKVFYGPEDDIVKFKILYDKVKTWKSTLFYINNELVGKPQLSRWLTCYLEKMKQINTAPLFCWGICMTKLTFTGWGNELWNIFGCNRSKLRDSTPKFQDTWYKHGVITSDGTFKVDKQRVSDILYDNLVPYRICPALNIKAVAYGLSLIPDEINPKEDKGWECFTLEHRPMQILPTPNEIHFDKENETMTTISCKTDFFNPCYNSMRVTPQFIWLANKLIEAIKNTRKTKIRPNNFNLLEYL